MNLYAHILCLEPHTQNKRTASVMGILCALFLSAFIYLEHFWDSASPLCVSICALLGLFLYLRLSRFGAFICGGVIGILWFYWVGFSLRFYELTALIPLVWGVFFLVYGGIFYGLCFFYNPLYRILTLTFSSLIHPFGFNWFIIESIFVKSYFFPSKYTLFFLLFGLFLLSLFLSKKLYKTSLIGLIFLCLLCSHTNSTTKAPKDSPLNIKTTSLDIPQNLRWNPIEFQNIITQNFQNIIQAKGKYDLVILPETAFPTALNLQQDILKTLKSLSQEIAILTGGIYKDDKMRYYNSAFLFQDGEMRVFHKLILVPFGEQIPLPKFLAKGINQIFFEGLEDFSAQPFNKPNTAIIKNQKFQIAICYEATREEFYKDSPQKLIAISNNAWFQPSIEPTLQKLLMLYFAKNHNTTIYHSSNASQDFILNAH